jgi:hypothetical protein
MNAVNINGTTLLKKFLDLFKSLIVGLSNFRGKLYYCKRPTIFSNMIVGNLIYEIVSPLEHSMNW